MSAVSLRQIYLDAAEYVRKHGLSDGQGRDGGPRCFAGAINSAMRGQPMPADVPELAAVISRSAFIHPVRDGWTTRDAIAAFEIAADLATP
jgi:hypothetical protein